VLDRPVARSDSPATVAILGAGPAGVGAAFKLRAAGTAEVDLFESQPSVGGNAASFEIEGQVVDFGSHRLHPACDPAILRISVGCSAPSCSNAPDTDASACVGAGSTSL